MIISAMSNISGLCRLLLFASDLLNYYLNFLLWVICVASIMFLKSWFFNLFLSSSPYTIDIHQTSIEKVSFILFSFSSIDQILLVVVLCIICFAFEISFLVFDTTSSDQSAMQKLEKYFQMRPTLLWSVI